MKSFFESPSAEIRLLDELRSWAGTPFMHKARVKGVGVDCVHLVGEVMSECRVVQSYDFGDYDLDWSQHHERSLIVDYIERTGRFAKLPSWETPCAGDVVCFRIGKCEQHCGILVNETRFFHVLVNGRVTVNQLDDATWSHRLGSVYRALPS
jgi:cell wall-associated NlpC family hydrolase